MRAAFSFFALAFWISSWFPTFSVKWAILAATACVVGLGTAIWVREKTRWRRWPAKLFMGLAIALLILGLVATCAVRSVGTGAEATIFNFFIMGFSGYLLMLSEIMRQKTNSTVFGGIGLFVLLILGSWSWASAFAMHVHRGVSEGGLASCILVPSSTGDGYDTELGSVWHMRLPQNVATRTGPTGTVLLDYHAILVAQTAEGSEVYNWSKSRLRFDILDKKRNPYLPTVCP